MEILDINGDIPKVINNVESARLNKINGHIDENNLCVRFIRKKFRCIIIFLLTLIALFELINNIISKMDNDNLHNVTKLFWNTTETGIH